MMPSEPLRFPEILPPIPRHLTGDARGLFVWIVNEMVDARLDTHPMDSTAITALVIILEILRQASRELSEATTEDQRWVCKRVAAENWTIATFLAKELLLSKEALKRALVDSLNQEACAVFSREMSDNV